MLGLPEHPALCEPMRFRKAGCFFIFSQIKILKTINPKTKFNMKRTLQTLLFALMSIMMPIGASAHDFEVDGIYYNITDSEFMTVEVTYSGTNHDAVVNEYTGEVAIPVTVTHGGEVYRVTSIDNYAFSYCSSLTSITIPNSLRSIGINAFHGCSKLTSITIPVSVTSINRGAFYGCSSLTSVTFPENSQLISIFDEAFYGCSKLTSITIPVSVTSISERAFYGCSSLTSVTFPENSQLISILDEAFYDCSKLTSITIPSGLTSIMKSTFCRCSSLTSITIPKSVTSIGQNAFYDCSSLTNITISESVTSIGQNAFRGCSSLASITIPGSVTTLPLGTFAECKSLTNVTINEGVTSIGNSSFSDCSKLLSIIIPSSVKSIGDSTFDFCSSFTDVHYLGSAEQWNDISIGSDNDALTKATRHYYDANGFCTDKDHKGEYEPATLNAEGYYEIENGGQLFWFAQQVNGGGEEGRYLNAILKQDIDLEGRPWTPIGTSGGTDSQSFRGVFDGNGKTIRGLYVNAQRSALGFFGEVRKGVVKDFTIYGDVFLNGKYNYIGGVIGSACGIQGENGSTISGITSYVNVTLGEGTHGSNHVAGLIGYVNHNTTVDRCMWLGTLDLDIYRAQDGVGGLIGKANAQYCGTISNCAAYGTIRTAYKSGSYVNPSDNKPFTNIFIGGIVSNSLAEATTNLENCIWAGKIVNETNLNSEAHISAIGTLNGTGSVTNCYHLQGSAPYVTTHNAHNTGIVSFTAKELASGEVAYNLGEAWGQAIGTDVYPILDGEKVYCDYLSCAEDAQAVYTNDANASNQKPEHNHVDGVCTMCGHIDTAGGVIISDGQQTAFIIAEDVEVPSITYTRTLPNLKWNALYVPFEIPVSELTDNYDVAYINDIRSYDDDENGELDRMTMEIIKLSSGTLHANHPYLIRAKNEDAKNMNLVLTDATLYKTVENSFTCSSMYMDFKVTGSYNSLSAKDLEGKYAISEDGAWQLLNKGTTLKPFRLYMEMTPRDGSPVKVESAALSRIRISVQGEEDGATGIEMVDTPQHEADGAFFDLSGRKVKAPVKGGIYIRNGKKILVK